jgi:hypothetical protein
MIMMGAANYEAVYSLSAVLGICSALEMYLPRRGVLSKVSIVLSTDEDFPRVRTRS